MSAQRQATSSVHAGWLAVVAWLMVPFETRIASGTSTRAGGPAKDNDGRQFPTSADGTPIFRLGEPQWGSRRLGTGSSLSAAGCAMTSMAMALPTSRVGEQHRGREPE